MVNFLKRPQKILRILEQLYFYPVSGSGRGLPYHLKSSVCLKKMIRVGATPVLVSRQAKNNLQQVFCFNCVPGCFSHRPQWPYLIRLYIQIK